MFGRDERSRDIYTDINNKTNLQTPMIDVFDIYKQNKGVTLLFCEVITVDWYDGPVEAVCRLSNASGWYLCSLVWIDFAKNSRIFCLTPVTLYWMDGFKKLIDKGPEANTARYADLKIYLRQSVLASGGQQYLFKGWGLDDPGYVIKEIPPEAVRYYDSVDAVAGCEEVERARWISYFG